MTADVIEANISLVTVYITVLQSWAGNFVKRLRDTMNTVLLETLATTTFCGIRKMMSERCGRLCIVNKISN